MYSQSIEAAVLSTAFFEEDEAIKLVAKLNEDDFFLPGHRAMFSIIKELVNDGLPVDESFVQPKLAKITKEWEIVLINVLASNPIANLDPYINELKVFTQKRKLNELSLNIRKYLADDKDTVDLISFVEDSIAAVQDTVNTGTSTRSMSEIIEEIEYDMDRAQRGEKIPYFRTGYHNFDSYVGGFVENGLTVVAARPSMGKSSFMSGPIESALSRGEGALLYSMEVVDKNALLRLISFKSQEPLSGLKIGSLRDYNAYKNAKEFFMRSDNLFKIIDRSGMSKKDLEIDITKRLREDRNIKIVLIDHLLQMKLDSSKHAPTELGGITKMLKSIAQNYKVSIVLLSQLNRSVESRDNKRPMMSDLQGSGSIEQDADMIVFLYRPEYYKEKEWDSEEKGEYKRPDIEHAEAIVGKNRDGPTGSVDINFRAKTASFLNDTNDPEIIEYIDEDFDENVDSKASTQDSSDIIDVQDDNYNNVDIPLI